MPRFFLKASFLICSVFLGGCAILGPSNDLPTLMPQEFVPTAIALTAEALVTPSDTPNPTATFTIEPTQVVAITVAANATAADAPEEALVDQSRDILPAPIVPENTLIPGAEIQIASPGPLSKIASPLSIIAYVTQGADGNAQVELWGEDGRLMYRRIFNFLTPNPQGRLVIKFGFETAGVAETAQLVIQTRDVHGRMKALASQEIILLAEGETDLNVAGDLLAPIVIQQPQDMTLVKGEALNVSGLVRTSSDQPLLVELVAADGKVVGSRLAGVVPTEKGEHHPFSTDIPFQVDAPTWVRVIVSERGGRFPGAKNIATLEVLLSP